MLTCSLGALARPFLDLHQWLKQPFSPTGQRTLITAKVQAWAWISFSWISKACLLPGFRQAMKASWISQGSHRKSSTSWISQVRMAHATSLVSQQSKIQESWKLWRSRWNGSKRQNPADHPCVFHGFSEKLQQCLWLQLWSTGENLSASTMKPSSNSVPSGYVKIAMSK